MLGPERCSAVGCGKPTAARLENRAFCREHFLGATYDGLDESRRWREGKQSRFTSVEAMGRFLVECSAEAAAISIKMPDLDNLERARLLDIALCTANLSQHLRRSLRKPLSIPVRLSCDEPGRAWKEETATRLLSRHGALIACQHSVKAGETLFVERMDTARQARVRVAWHRPENSGALEVGIEFVDCEDFWEPDWGSM